MMLKPSLTDILKDGESYYSLVVAVAKRAREIAADAEKESQILVEKPVQLAVEEFGRGDSRFIERENIGADIE